MKTKLILFLILVIFSISCSERKSGDPISEYNQVVTKYTELQPIPSRVVDDTFYIYIRLPKYYGETRQRYPVLYLLDGDISFNMAISIVRYLQYGKHIPDIIIVAPSYGTMMSDKETNYRERDYTISRIERFRGSGEASNYLKFFKHELIPFIDSLYRTDSMRILNGFSLGGLFAFYTMATEPELFDNYIVGSPYLINDIEFLEKTIRNSPPFISKKRVFISVGKLEDNRDYHEPATKIIDALDVKRNILIKFRKFENGTHFTTPSEALTYGLRFIFDKQNMEELSPE